jgi:hypothetical protein
MSVGPLLRRRYGNELRTIFSRDLLNLKFLVFYIENTFAYKKVPLKTLIRMKKALMVVKIIKKIVLFWNLKLDNYSARYSLEVSQF